MEAPIALVKLVESGLGIHPPVNVSGCVAEVLMHPQVNILAHCCLSLQWLTVAAWKIPRMAKSSSLVPHLSQLPTTPALWDMISAMETALALVKLMENGLGIHPPVNVSG